MNLTSMAGAELLHPISAGPLMFRRLLGSALIVDADDEATNCTLFREYVQPYNFTRTKTGASFLTPTHREVKGALVGGYANISLYMASGTAANVTRLLFLTEDCPTFGMAGRGASCRPCPPGGYCPGGQDLATPRVAFKHSQTHLCMSLMNVLNLKSLVLQVLEQRRTFRHTR